MSAEEEAKSLKRRRIWLVAIVLALIIPAWVVLRAPEQRSMREFNADRVADLELRMWQAYYAKENLRLFALLVRSLREQYGYSWATATVEGFHLARAAATFGNLKEGYDVVLPDLEAAYKTLKTWHGAGYDPGAVARAELAWWVARRIPGQNSPTQVGRLIAEEYAMQYEVPREQVDRAGLLRAEAAALRDSQAASPDWATIGGMLTESYRDLRRGLER
jgi:hypothetical protein